MALQLPTDSRRPDSPTTRPWPSFNPEQDAKDLHEAILGLETHHNVIIRILAKRTVSQRKQIAGSYQTLFEKKLEEDLDEGLSGNSRNVVLSALKDIPEMKAIAMHKALKGLGTSEQVFIQTLAVASNNEIQQIKEAYTKFYECDLETDIANETSGDFQSVMLLLIKAERSEDPIVNQARAINDSFMVCKYGKKMYGTEESVFTKILTTRSFLHIKLMANYYKKKYQKKLERILFEETSGDYQKTLLSIVMYAEDPVKLYASWIYDSMKSMETNDDDLIRLILSRAEIDLQNIKAEYYKMAEKTLIEDIAVATSGDYKDILIALVNGNFEEIPDELT